MLSPKQNCRLVALREITSLIGQVNYGGGCVQFPHESSQYMDDSTKEMIRREIEHIRFQLLNRMLKLEDQLYERSQ